MPVDLKGSVLVRNQRNLFEIKRLIEKYKGYIRNLEKEKSNLILNSNDQSINGRIKTLNGTIVKVNEEIEKLKEERNKIEVKVPLS